MTVREKTEQRIGRLTIEISDAIDRDGFRSDATLELISEQYVLENALYHMVHGHAPVRFGW